MGGGGGRGRGLGYSSEFFGRGVRLGFPNSDLFQTKYVIFRYSFSDLVSGVKSPYPFLDFQTKTVNPYPFSDQNN